MVWAIAAVALLVLVHVVFAMRFRRLGRALVSEIGTRFGGSPQVPQLMRAFAERGGAEGAPSFVELRQTCEMRLSRGADWQPLSAEQTIGLRDAGFVWSARMAKGPLTIVRVIDAYAGGVGCLHVRLFGSIPMGSSVGPDADRGEAMRYLAELPWAPDAILQNGALQWREVDDLTIEVGLELSDGPATVRFTFDEAGDVVQVDADRPTDEIDADGQTVSRPWRCLMGDYGELGGRRIPREGEAGYVYDDGYEAYWRGRVVAYATR